MCRILGIYPLRARYADYPGTLHILHKPCGERPPPRGHHSSGAPYVPPTGRGSVRNQYVPHAVEKDAGIERQLAGIVRQAP